MRSASTLATASARSRSRRSVTSLRPSDGPFCAGNRETYFKTMVSSFGSTGRPRTTKRMVEDAQKVAPPPSGPLAREAVSLLVGGFEQVVEIVRQPRHLGGTQAFWLCPKCSALRAHLYVLAGELGCRACLHLDYRSRHVLHPALTRAARLRRKLGAAPGVLSALPPKPPCWSRAYYARLVGELLQAESVIAEMLSGTIRALERRKGRLHGRR